MATCKSCLEWRKGKVFRPLLYNTFPIGNEALRKKRMCKCENGEMWKWVKGRNYPRITAGNFNFQRL